MVTEGEDVLADCHRGKSPGLDGCPLSFTGVCRICSEVCWQRFTLSGRTYEFPVQHAGVMILIRKDTSSGNNIIKFRFITLSIVELKILANASAKRLVRVSGAQKCAILGNPIQGNLSLIGYTIDRIGKDASYWGIKTRVKRLIGSTITTLRHSWRQMSWDWPFFWISAIYVNIKSIPSQAIRCSVQD